MTDQSLTDAINYFDDFITYKFPYLDVPSISIAVMRKNKIAYSKALGLADVESGREATAETPYRVASNSKMFTSVAIMQLQEAGKLRLDDYVAAHVSWINKHIDKRWQTVTIRQLLSHSAGISRDSSQSGYWSLQYAFPDDETLKDVIIKDQLVFDPNTKMKYSNYGYGLLGQVIKSASGIEYNDYVKNNIILPLDLKSTYPEYESTLDDALATGYTTKTGLGRRIPIDTAVTAGALSAATGFVATPSDLATFIASIFNSESLVSTESSREMRRTHSKIKYGLNLRSHYGLGFGIGEIHRMPMISHSGGFPGQAVETIYLPSLDISISVAINCRGLSPLQIVRSLINTIIWFSDNYVDEPKYDLSRFTTRTAHLWGESNIIGYGNSVISLGTILPLDFENAEWLERINNTTLKTVNANSFASSGEIMQYVFKENGSLDYINDQGTKLYSVNDRDEKWSVLSKITLPDTKN